MASPNYRHEKRQKDLARQKKQEEKRLKKANRQASKAEEGGQDPNPVSEEEKGIS